MEREFAADIQPRGPHRSQGNQSPIQVTGVPRRDKRMTDLRPLKGARIWLSGSISPEIENEAVDSFSAFVARISELIFSAGGSIIHGSHPSIVPTLLNSAAKHQAAKGSRDCL